MIRRVVTNNDVEVKEAFSRFMTRYDIPQVQILTYNSKANDVIKQSHVIIKEFIVKACEESVNEWSWHVHSTIFANKVTTSRFTKYSPYFLLYDVEPVLPLNLFKSTFLVQGFTDQMSDSDLLTLRIRQLEKREDDLEKTAQLLARMHFTSKAQFEKRFAKRITKQVFQEGDFVLMRNTQIEKELNRKTKPRYLGPFIVVSRSLGNAYELREVNDGTRREKVAAFRLIPYIARDQQALQELLKELPNESNDDDEEEEESLNDKEKKKEVKRIITWHNDVSYNEEDEEEETNESNENSEDEFWDVLLVRSWERSEEGSSGSKPIDIA